MKGTFVSIWDDGIEVSTPAELDETTGEITTESVDVSNLDILQREYFESSEFQNSGEEFEVCPECHNFITKVVVKEGVGKTLNEVPVCSDPDCDNQ
jgi:hypothetical protein